MLVGEVVGVLKFVKSHLHVDQANLFHELPSSGPVRSPWNGKSEILESALGSCGPRNLCYSDNWEKDAIYNFFSCGF